MTQLSHLAYNGISLASGGVAGMAYRAEKQFEAAQAKRQAAIATIKADTRLTPPDRWDISCMISTQELSPAEALEWADSIAASRPWYGR